MKKILSLMIFGIFLISLVNAIPVCIDFDDPSTPPNLAVTSSGTNIILTWDAATDIPNCSGIDYYNICRDGKWIGTTSSDILTYTDENVPYGTYSYTVYAVDKVVHNSGYATKSDVVLSEPTNGGGDTTVSGGGPSSRRCKENWRCGDWGKCENGIQTRICEDINKCGTKKSKPDIQRVCDIEGESGDEALDVLTTTEPPSFFSRITGAVIGGGTARIIIPIIFIILIVWAVITVYIKRRVNVRSSEDVSAEDVEEVV